MGTKLSILSEQHKELLWGSLQAWLLSAIHFLCFPPASRAVTSGLSEGVFLPVLLGLLQQQLECTGYFQIHTARVIDVILPFGSESELLNSFQKWSVDVCGIVSVKQEVVFDGKSCVSILFLFSTRLYNVFWCSCFR